MSGTFWGYDVPEFGNLEASVCQFNRGEMAYCDSCTCCTGIRCSKCIFRGAESKHKIAAFAVFAIEQGYEVHRSGVKLIDGKYICEICGNLVEDNKNQICNHCMTLITVGNIQRCGDCGAYISPADAHYACDNPNPFCKDCATGFVTCTHCNESFYYRSSVVRMGDGYICKGCFVELGYEICDRCGAVHNHEEMFHVGCTLCSTCFEEYRDRVIHDYSWKPKPMFKSTEKDGKKPIYLGFELEAGDAEEDDRDTIAKMVAGCSTYIYLKRDGSIPDYGFEMVTHPMTFWYHKDCMPYKAILNMMADGGMRSRTASESCGLHVHVNRDALSADRWLMVDWFVHKYKSNWETIARRKDEYYAKFKNIDHTKSMKDSYGLPDDRYTAVNFCNRNTVEFRLFNGTLRYETLIGTLCLVDALISWAKVVKVNDILCRGAWESYIAFIKSDSKYDDAIEYLKYRKMED